MICKFKTNNGLKKVIWEITNRCNYNCKYCIFNSNSNLKELTLKECKKVIDELLENDFNYIKFTGGEPFIRSDFIDILEYANNKIQFDISTNASLINDEHIKRLKNLNINFLHISIDGLEAEHDFIRGYNTFKKTLDGLERLKHIDKYIRIGTVLYKYNQDKIKEIVQMIEEIDNIDEVIFSIMEPFGQLTGNNSLYITKSLEEISNDINKITSKIKISYNWNDINTELEYCPAGNKILFIDNEGFVSPCTWIEKVKPKLKNETKITDLKLSEIINKFNINYNCCIYDEVFYDRNKKCTKNNK